MSLLAQQGMMMRESVNPLAASLYAKLAEWWTCDALSSGALVGQHSARTLAARGGGGSAVIVTGHVGNAVDIVPNYGFYGANNNVVGTITSTSPTSIAAWYRPDSLAANAFVASIRRGDSIQGRDHRLLVYVDTSGGVHAFAGDGVNFVDSGASSNTLGVGTFGFCQAEVTPNGGLGKLRSRLNAGAWKTETPLATSPTINPAYRLGFDYNGASTEVGHCNGSIDEVAFFNAALTDDEWNYLYNGGAGRSYAQLKLAAGH